MDYAKKSEFKPPFRSYYLKRKNQNWDVWSPVLLRKSLSTHLKIESICSVERVSSIVRRPTDVRCIDWLSTDIRGYKKNSWSVICPSTQSVYFKLSLQSFYWWLPFQHCVQTIHEALASLCDSSTFLTHVWQFYISKYGCIKKLHKATPGCNVYDACQMVYLFTFGVTVDIHRKQRHVIGYQRQISQ